MKTIQIDKHAKSAEEIELSLIKKEIPTPDSTNNCLIRVSHVGINPSDAPRLSH